MLLSVPRVVAVMAFTLATCVMAAPTAIAAPKSLDDRVKELAVNVNELELTGKSKEVMKQQDVRCRDATLERNCVALGALCASDVWRARFPSVAALVSRRPHAGEQYVRCRDATLERSCGTRRAMRI